MLGPPAPIPWSGRANPVVSLPALGLACTRTCSECSEVEPWLKVCGPCFGKDNLHLRHPCSLLITHAPSVPGVGRGCDGYAGASSATRGPVFSGPRRPGRASSRAPSVKGLPGTLGVPWVAVRRPRWRRFLSRATLWPVRSAPSLEPRGSGLEPFGGQRTPRHYWRFTASGWPGPPGSRALRKVLLPGAGRCHVKNGSIHVPSQAATREVCHTRRGPGISGDARTGAHGESRQSSCPPARPHRRLG